MSDDVFSSPPPNLSETEVFSFVRKNFGDPAQIETHVGERDQNILVSLADGSKFFLKIANQAESLGGLEAQGAALAHLLERTPSFPVPKVIPNRSGKQILTIRRKDKPVEYLARAMSVIDGVPIANVHKSDVLLTRVGELLGQISTGLQGFFDLRLVRPNFFWNLDSYRTAVNWIADIDDADLRRDIASFIDAYEARACERRNLRQSILYQDANDYNILVSKQDRNEITGVIDFGDMVFGRTVNEPAIAMAYMAMNEAEPVEVMLSVLQGYVSEFPLFEAELNTLFDQIRLRLVQSICISAKRQKVFSDNQYLSVSRNPAEELFTKLMAMDTNLVSALFRSVASPAIEMKHRLGLAPSCIFSPTELRRLRAFDRTSFAASDIAVLGYGRSIGEPDASGKGAKVALGLCLRSYSRAPLFAPADAFVERVIEGETGSVLILRVSDDEPTPIFVLIRNIRSAGLLEGQAISAGASIGELAEIAQNSYETMIQVLRHSTTVDALPPQSVDREKLRRWSKICPDPRVMLDLPEELFENVVSSPEVLQKRRRKFLAPSLSLSYKSPLSIVRGVGPYLIGHDGRHYLDMVNNVTHVGHCNPRVVRAIQEQVATLNTNARYLHTAILDYAERLTSTLPDPLNVCIFVNSGSEANEVALRMARAHTGRAGAIAIEGAYHGHSTALIDVSSYKFDGPGGAGRKPHVHLAPVPDPYRGAHTGYSEQSAQRYADELQSVIAEVSETHEEPALFICESLQGVGGQIIPPKSYLRHAFRVAREQGLVCIADEVQVGLGRVGSHMWAFDSQDAVPDIVTIGKPIGNGHPVSAVVTTPEIAASFANGMEYFNTFGGNPVSCAAAIAVLDSIEEEGLQQNAHVVGSYLLERLNELAQTHTLIGDVRGLGLFIGVELVRDRDTKDPASEEALFVVEHLRTNGILLSTEGPYNCVLKIKPPIVFRQEHADDFLKALDLALTAAVERGGRA